MNASLMNFTIEDVRTNTRTNVQMPLTLYGFAVFLFIVLSLYFGGVSFTWAGLTCVSLVQFFGSAKVTEEKINSEENKVEFS